MKIRAGIYETPVETLLLEAQSWDLKIGSRWDRGLPHLKD